MARKRNGEKVETTAYAGFMRRAMKAYAKRIGAGDIAALPEFVAMRDELDRHILDVITELRSERWNYSWAQIGDVLGIHRSTAQQRYADAGGARKPGGQPANLR